MLQLLGQARVQNLGQTINLQNKKSVCNSKGQDEKLPQHTSAPSNAEHPADHRPLSPFNLFEIEAVWIPMIAVRQKIENSTII
jgi:hypothetical protein